MPNRNAHHRVQRPSTRAIQPSESFEDILNQDWSRPELLRAVGTEFNHGPVNDFAAGLLPDQFAQRSSAPINAPWNHLLYQYPTEVIRGPPTQGK